MPADNSKVKTCPKCDSKDITTFSTCKFCGTNYSSQGKPKPTIFTDKTILGLCLLIIFGIAIWWYCKQAAEEHEAKFKTLREAIIASLHPRVISFYADWCPACRSFDPILINLVGSYGNSIELQMINTDDIKNRELMKAFNVHGIPATFIFDRHGHQIGENFCSAPRTVLDSAIKKVVEEK